MEPVASSYKGTPIHMRVGTHFNMILPPAKNCTMLDDRVINVRVHAVGEIRGKEEAYHAAVLQRKLFSVCKWGVLETLDASAFPDEAHCQVRTHTRSRIHTIAPYTF